MTEQFNLDWSDALEVELKRLTSGFQITDTNLINILQKSLNEPGTDKLENFFNIVRAELEHGPTREIGGLHPFALLMYEFSKPYYDDLKRKAESSNATATPINVETTNEYMQVVQRLSTLEEYLKKVRKMVLQRVAKNTSINPQTEYFSNFDQDTRTQYNAKTLVDKIVTLTAYADKPQTILAPTVGIKHTQILSSTAQQPYQDLLMNQ